MKRRRPAYSRLRLAAIGAGLAMLLSPREHAPSQQLPAQGSVPDSAARIEWSRTDHLLSIKGTFGKMSGPAREFRYVMISDKQGTGGGHRTRQEGTFQSSSAADVLLSSTTVNMARGDLLAVTLEIREGERLVGGDSLALDEEGPVRKKDSPK